MGEPGSILLDPEATSELLPLFWALRKRGDEAQLTQLIAAVARSDADFATQLARLILEASGNAGIAAEMPDRLECRAEQRLYDQEGEDLGRVDLLFADAAGTFTLLAELKLHSGYGHRQLDRYAASLSGLTPGARWLVAITKIAPHSGEDSVAADPRWLGSIRWADIYDGLHALGVDLAPRRPVLAEAWSTILWILREQGDFGPMDFDPALIAAWARRDEAERLLLHVLNELAKPTLDRLRTVANGTPVSILRKGPSQPIFLRKNRALVRFAVSDGGPEIFRIQFLGWGDGRFTAEARYQHPRETLSGSLLEASDAAGRSGLQRGQDSAGHHWKRRAVCVSELPHGMQAHDLLVEEIHSTIDACAASGLLGALIERKPTTEASEEELAED